jgi:hypothetical protein
MTVQNPALQATVEDTPISRGSTLGVVLALLATVTVFVVGNLGAPIRVVTGWNPDGADLTLAEVVITSSVAVVLGGFVLAFLERRRTDALRLWESAAVALAVVSALPQLRLEIDAGSKVSLAAMHLLTGAAAIAGHRIVRRNAH